ncbi:MAG: SET domain-containing protein [Cytophagaceae bacterium]|nr:SET domain-containing protein [Cytophagaceae bacterium]
MRRRFLPGTFDLIVKRSQTGRGLFAGEKISRGSCIIEYIGKPATKKQIKENTGKYLFWTGRGTMIDGNIVSNKARFINHSCAPNCEIDIKKRRVYIFAKLSIKEGEELTYNYGTEYFEEQIEPHGCKCFKCLFE